MATPTLEVPAVWMWHTLNAYVAGDRILADFVGYDAPDHFLGPDAAFRMIMQERLFFRNIPLSNWVEHEMVVEEEGADVQHIAKGRSIFSTKSLNEESKSAVSRLLEQASSSQFVAAMQNGDH